MLLSFIIPTYNENKNIVRTLKFLKRHVPPSWDYEIIAVDHGSSDNTVELASKNGAIVYIQSEATIAGLRNYGVSHSIGKILVFLDADVLLTPQWGKHIVDVVKSLSSGERTLTGSCYSVPDNSSWIEEYFFKPLQHGGNIHINSGHMIISRKLFDELGGFDERLETGEDYELSMRAKGAGLELIDDVELKVIHEGYPKTLGEFIKREYWHGKGDAQSLSSLFRSKVAVLALIFFMLHISFIAAILAPDVVLALFLLSAIVIIPLGSSFVKYRREPLTTILVNGFLYYCYFWARSISILSFAGMRKLRKRTR